jgi:hypothetical protein
MGAGSLQEAQHSGATPIAPPGALSDEESRAVIGFSACPNPTKRLGPSVHVSAFTVPSINVGGIVGIVAGAA